MSNLPSLTHKTRHATGGPDALSPADIGAQVSDADLTAIAALDSTQAGVIASDGSGWLRKTYAQLKTALGLGGAATLNVGTSTGTVAAGDDSRIVGAVQKSLGTTKGDTIAFSGSGAPVRVAAGADGTFLAGDSSAAAGVSFQQGLTASSLTLGSTNGVLKKPWGRQAFIGPELWSATFFDTGTVNSIAGQTSTTPSLTGNSTLQRKITRIQVGNTGSTNGIVQETYRFDYTINNSASGGAYFIAIRALDTTGATISGSELFLWGGLDSAATNYRNAFDYTTVGKASNGARWIEVEINLPSGTTSGTLGLSNVSLRQVAAARPSLSVSWQGTNGPLAGAGSLDGLNIDVPIVDPVTASTLPTAAGWPTKFVRKLWAPDSMLRVSPQTATVYSGTTYGQNFQSGTGGSGGNCVNAAISGGVSRGQHIGNNGQIMGVVKADASTELRCNTHGGEWGRTTQTVTDGVLNSTTTITSATANFTTATHGGATVTGTGIPQGTYIVSVTNTTTAVLSASATASASGVTLAIAQYASNFIFELDYGDGTWVTFNDVNRTHNCRRVRITCHTQITRSDQTTPFANVDNVFTIFDDGTVRFDRTITFLASQQMAQWFYFMHSFDATTPILQPGRLGYGQQVDKLFDPRQYLNAPAAPTASNTGTGGTYGALTRTYSVTAITPQGESLASATVASTTASGTTNSFTVTMPSTQSGQTAWGVYDTTGRLTVIPVAQTTWVDTTPTYGTVAAPSASSAVVLPGTQQYVRSMSDRADWAATYDPYYTNVVFGTITDRDNALTYPGAVALTAEWDSHSGVMKNYWQLFDGNGLQPTSPGVVQATKDSYTQTISNGTVLTTTAYSFTYAPLDRVNWHREIANRGQGFKQFNTVYPAT